jgi:hypothetical protein
LLHPFAHLGVAQDPSDCQLLPIWDVVSGRCIFTPRFNLNRINYVLRDRRFLDPKSPDFEPVSSSFPPVTRNAVEAVIKLYDLEEKSFEARSKALEAENQLLKETQYDRAAALLDGQKKVYETEHELLVKQIDEAKKAGSASAEEVTRLQGQLEKVAHNIQTLDASRSILKEQLNITQSTFEKDASFQYDLFDKTVDFYGAYFRDAVNFESVTFTGNASFEETAFKGTVSSKGVDLRRGSFEGTDLRGVDLSKAIIDANTKLPVVAK